MNKEQEVLKVYAGWVCPKDFSGCVEYPNGNKVWYAIGKRHREDGPAIEWENGLKEWWLNGKIHREDGPAVEWASGRKQWFLNDQQYTESAWKKEVAKLNAKPVEEVKTLEKKSDEPVVLNVYKYSDIPKGFSGIAVYRDGSKEWRLNGEFHREDGPAVEGASGRKEWWLNGNNYSEEKWKKEVAKLNVKPVEEAKTMKENVLKLGNNDNIPSEFTGLVLRNNGKEWWLNGKLHREDGPAYEGANGHKEWLLNGKFHREDGPAMELADGLKSWYLNGKIYSENDWKKEVAKLNAKPVEEAKVVEENVLKLGNNDNIPSEFTGIALRENGTKLWFKNGKYHREDGPAVEWANGSKGWWLNGKHYFEDDWKKEVAKLNTKPVEEVKTLEKKSDEPVVLNLRSREDIPGGFSGITAWPNGNKAWYANGKLHREDGPAVEYVCGSKSWYLNGKSYSEDDWKKEIARRKGLLATKEEKIQTMKTEEPKHSLKSDFKQAGIRVACRRTVSVVRETLVSIITVGKSKTETKRIRDGIGALFDTEVGKGLVGYIMGACLPYVKEHFPERYQSIVDELATEFRIEGLAVVGDEALKGLLPLLGLAKTGIIEAMNGLVSGDSPPVRVDTERPAVLNPSPEPVAVEEIETPAAVLNKVK